MAEGIVSAQNVAKDTQNAIRTTEAEAERFRNLLSDQLRQEERIRLEAGGVAVNPAVRTVGAVVGTPVPADTVATPTTEAIAAGTGAATPKATQPSVTLQPDGARKNKYEADPRQGMI